LTKKYSFAVENIEMFDENPDSNFAVVSLDFFSSGKNRHDLFVSEDTLMRTSSTIKNCPLVWKYDDVLDDVYTHDDEEVPCGFVPESANIKAKKISDGRVMLNTTAYVWKRYTGQLLDIFKRDGGVKPVSVEMSVYKLEPMPDGLYELKDYRFEGITILGSYVRPAIPDATATVLSFSKQLKKEYKDALKDEVSSKNIQLDKSFIEQLNQEKQKKEQEPFIATFPYKSKTDMNPALKGITPPISLGQANEISRQADAIGVDKKKNGWAIAISNFKKTHKVVNGKWVKKESKMSENPGETNKQKNVNTEKENNMNKDELKNSSQEKLDGAKISSKKEQTSEEKDKEKKEKKENFEYPENFNMEEMAQLFSDDKEDKDIKMAKEEIVKGKYASPQILMSGMFAQMKKMSKTLQKMAEKNKAYMEENEKLRKFKEEVEGKEKQFQIRTTLEELEEKVIIPEEAKEEMLAEAKNYSFKDIEGWTNYCKAKSFDFEIRKDKMKEKSEVLKAALPFKEEKKQKESLWA